jgi:STE24 endopeptidase
LFFGIIWLVYEVVSLPFELYSIFVIEQKFGFNTMTTQIYITDKIKSMLLSVIIGGVLLSLIIWLYLIFDTKFWLFALLVITGFSVFMSLFYTQLIVPLFNKLTPLEEGELKTAISAFAKKVAFPLHGISIIDNSKRSTKSNAYFTGFGRKKRIVLFDTLIQNHTTDELVAVLAHEIGHYKKKHIQLGLMLGIFQTGMLLFILSLLLSEPIFQFAIGVNVPSFHSALIVFGLLYTPFSFILGVFGNTLSRYNEYAADKFAGEKYSPEALRKALVKLSGDNLSNLTPHPWYVKVNYSHPPLLQRLAALNRIKE